MTGGIASLAQSRAPALLALVLLVLAVAAGVGPVVVLGLQGSGAAFDSYILGVARFTLLQAGLSTFLSLALGIPVARALARRHFFGRGLMVRLLSLPMAIPAIVAVLGLVEIFGAHGLLGGVFNLYGLTGILLAHVFFNFPLAARMGLSALEAVPAETHRLAAQLGFSDRDLWRHVDRPALAAAMPGAALLIFLLCAASFTIVLTLGGGPKATTLEVAIYQSLRFDFDPARATLLSLVQVAICAALVALAQRFPASFSALPPLRRGSVRHDGGDPASKLLDGIFLVSALLLLLPPLVAVAAAGVFGIVPTAGLLQAILTSIAIGSGAALLSFALCWPLASLAARSRAGRRAAGGLVLAGLILPPAVMATGWFILLSRFADVMGLAPLLVLILNALMALPFTYTILAPALAQAAEQNDRLCASLGLSGLDRFRLVDFPVLRRVIGLALVLAAIVSLGDLTAITLFGAEGFVTLPALLYQQMGSYRMEGASGTALVLALLALALVALAERWSRAGD